MRLTSWLLPLLAVWPSVGVGLAGTAAAAATHPAFAVAYEGGSLPFRQHKKVTATLAGHELILQQGTRRFAVPAAAITRISEGTAVHRHMVPGLKVWKQRGKTREHFVGLTWASAETGGRPCEVVFAAGNADPGKFVSALESLTGRKSVNADVTGMIVRYDRAQNSL